MATFRQISWQEFVDEFQPVKNQFDKDAAYDGYMFQTDDICIPNMLKFTPACLWTLLSEGNETWIANGYHFVNRLGYFITEIPFPIDSEIEADRDTWGCEDHQKEDENGDCEDI